MSTDPKPPEVTRSVGHSDAAARSPEGGPRSAQLRAGFQFEVRTVDPEWLRRGHPHGRGATPSRGLELLARPRAGVTTARGLGPPPRITERGLGFPALSRLSATAGARLRELADSGRWAAPVSGERLTLPTRSRAPALVVMGAGAVVLGWLLYVWLGDTPAPTDAQAPGTESSSSATPLWESSPPPPRNETSSAASVTQVPAFAASAGSAAATPGAPSAAPAPSAGSTPQTGPRRRAPASFDIKTPFL